MAVGGGRRRIAGPPGLTTLHNFLLIFQLDDILAADLCWIILKCDQEMSVRPIGWVRLNPGSNVDRRHAEPFLELTGSGPFVSTFKILLVPRTR